MSITEHLSVDQASRLAVTAVADDLEYWARSAAVHGRVHLADLLEVLELFRADSSPQHSTTAGFPTLVAG